MSDGMVRVSCPTGKAFDSETTVTVDGQVIHGIRSFTYTLDADTGWATMTMEICGVIADIYADIERLTVTRVDN